LFLGWVSGIFGALRRKPKLRLWVKPGPTICTTFSTGEKWEGYNVHRTAISVYLGVANIGTVATSIRNVAIGYHWHLRPFSLTGIKSRIFWQHLIWNRIRYAIFWEWIKQPFVALDDFQTTVAAQRSKIYPSLFQGSTSFGTTTDTYLEPGKIVSGIVYFELDDSWGGRFPAVRARQTRIKIAVEDAFGVNHKKTFWIPVGSLSEAQKFNPSFGQSLSNLKSVSATAAKSPE
jgi:hypothetical protein